MSTVPRFEVRKKRNLLGKMRWRVVLIGLNGEPLSTSESLNSEDAAQTNINAQQQAVPGAAVVWL